MVIIDQASSELGDINLIGSFIIYHESRKIDLMVGFRTLETHHHQMKYGPLTSWIFDIMDNIMVGF